MVDLAREAFSTNNFDLAAVIYERTIRENGPTSELLLGLADSLARGGQFAKAFQSYTNAYRFGKVSPEKLKHLVIGLVDTVKQDMVKYGSLQIKKRCMFMCGLCRGLWFDPVTLLCGHTFCRNCLEKVKVKICEVCNVHYRSNIRNINSNVVLANLAEKWFPHKCAVARLKKKANEYFSVNDYQKANEVYSQAIQIDRTDHLLYSNRSHCYVLVNQFEDALTDAEQVVLLRPDWPKGYFRKGCALYGLLHYEEAVISFLQCLALDKVSSAKVYLSKALDKILSALPPDDPKAHALQQQNKPTLQQLIESNFSQPVLLPNMVHTLSHIECNVRDALNMASSFSGELTPEVLVTASNHKPETVEHEHPKQNCGNGTDCACSVSTDRLKCNLSSDENDTCKNEQTCAPSPVSRKRQRTACAVQCPFLLPHSSPQKVQNAVSGDSAEAMTNPMTKTAEPQQTEALSSLTEDGMKPEQLSIEDLECGLCYRLYYEPVTTPCGHTFCRKCLDRCLDHTITCPMCKGNLTEYLAERRQTVTEALQCIIKTFFGEAYADRCKINEEEMIELTRMGSSQESDIPVFVCILAFPTIPCPLHVFEPRYRLMVRQCMESGTRQFGMCASTGENDEDFSDYGCMLEIRDVQYFPDGRSVVDTIGGRRFKVLSRGKRDGYNVAKVEFISDRPMEADELQVVSSLQVEIHAMVKDWLARLPTVHRVRIAQHFGEIPDLDSNLFPSPNGPKWAWWAVAVLPMDPRVQMALLAMPSCQERLTALKKVLLYMSRRGVR